LKGGRDKKKIFPIKTDNPVLESQLRLPVVRLHRKLFRVMISVIDLDPKPVHRITRCQSYKTFFFVTDKRQNNLECLFALVKPFQLGLIFAGKAMASILLAYIGSSFKCFLETNTLAYFIPSLMAKKCPINIDYSWVKRKEEWLQVKQPQDYVR
jgi:hypothetical protein